MPDAPFVRSHLEFVGANVTRRDGHRYASTYDLVLREGAAYEPAEYVDGWWAFTGRPRHCFRNALLLAHLHPDDLTYVEGYAAGVIPVLHAWCVTADGHVVDPTWTTGNGREYVGIAFDTDWVEAYTDVRGIYGVIDDWQHDWPLVRDGIPADARPKVAR